ncbi:unnamed protein product [Boreogadus saida]
MKKGWAVTSAPPVLPALAGVAGPSASVWSLRGGSWSDPTPPPIEDGLHSCNVRCTSSSTPHRVQDYLVELKHATMRQPQSPRAVVRWGRGGADGAQNPLEAHGQDAALAAYFCLTGPLLGSVRVRADRKRKRAAAGTGCFLSADTRWTADRRRLK